MLLLEGITFSGAVKVQRLFNARLFLLFVVIAFFSGYLLLFKKESNFLESQPKKGEV